MTTIKDFQIISKLGEGAYSSVYKVKRLSDSQEYALKKVKLQNLSDKEKQNALNEVRILASISHTNIIAYKEAFLDEQSNSLCVIMEYANNGDLFQKICEHQKKGTNFQENEIWNIFIQMVNALKALHDLKVFHRDLKSANVFLNKDGTVKLGDLNVSKVAKKGLLYTQTGTPYYASPEVWRDMPYDNKSDVWSLGCVLYEITTLNPPFRAEDMEGLYKKVLKGYYPRIPTHYSQDLSNLIRALLQVSPHLRPSCNKILQFPSLVKRIEERHLLELEEGQQSALLNTIRVPKNLRFLTEKLPKANYSLLRTRKMDKNKFLQTLAGHKDNSSNQSLMGDDVIRGSESVDSYKKDKDRIYLPPVGKDGQSDIAKIYGAKQRVKKDQGKAQGLNAPRPNVVDDDQSYDGMSSELRKQADIKKKIKNLEKEIKETEREVSVSLKRIERKNSGHAADNRVAYKIHNLNQDADFDKQGSEVRSIHSGKANPRIMAERPEDKDPVQALIKKHRNHLNNRRKPSPEPGEYHSEPKKDGKLPQLVPDKKLPPLNGNGDKSQENSVSPKKKKIKELSKVYKVNIGELDDLSDKYSNVIKPLKKDKLVPIGKQYDGYPLSYGVNGIKYGKGYDHY